MPVTQASADTAPLLAVQGAVATITLNRPSQRFVEPRLRERENLTAKSRDFAEGRAAFHERRAPKFEGR